MHPISNENFWQIITIIIHLQLQWISILFVLFICSKARRPKNSIKPANTKKENQQELAVPENTKTDVKAASVPTTPSVAQPTNVQPQVPLNTKQINSPKTKQKGSKSKREKSKESNKEKSKKESNFKKFFKFATSRRDSHKSKKEKKDKSLDEVTANSGGEDEKNNNNEKIPFSSSKARKRKQHGEALLQTAEGGEIGNVENVDDDEPKVVDPIKVVQMGNIDNIAQQERQRRLKEIDQMPEGNLCEEHTQLSESIKKDKLHVKIAENNCKLYETNADPATKSFKESIRKRKKIQQQIRTRSKGSDQK